ncbi:rod shape-determining protein MreD [Parabacteroides sp. An277]|uniref:rod shape-determining protein MreD n=1 Tax=Parabacteroides sp. An277 TaxID=1965619 RepID=UPI000B39BD2B|nr:rod shape-determining protein MreD [Parabacteroides sp. An277]OUO52357.1 rod shape-determining protein MreD [Parabacteroides sp. An277]
MINKIVRVLVYFGIFVLLQILVLNNIHYLRIATPFLYVYCILKLPVGMSRSSILIFSFLTGLLIDMFSNTPGMHAAACSLAGFLRDPLLVFLKGEDLPKGLYPSYHALGYAGFIRYMLLFVLIHHLALFLIEALTLFDPLFLFIRIAASVLTTSLLICVVELFNFETQKIGE